MAREPCTDIYRKKFADTTIAEVRQKGKIVQEHDPKIWRKDIYGKLMKFSDYGKTESIFGWEVDHIKPVAKGGTDDKRNLQALQWQSNHKKSDNYL